jgi:hypothetical protein
MKKQDILLNPKNKLIYFYISSKYDSKTSMT